MGTFVLCAQLTFPYARVREKLVATVGGDGGRIARAWFPGRFTVHDAKLFHWNVERVDVRVRLAALLSGKVDLAFDAVVGPRRVTGTMREDAAAAWLDIDTGEARARLALPAGRLSAATGTIVIACRACASPRRVALVLGGYCVAAEDADLVGELPFEGIDCSPPPAEIEAPVAAAPPTQPVRTQGVAPPQSPGDIGDKGGRPVGDSDLPAPPPPNQEAAAQPLVLEY